MKRDFIFVLVEKLKISRFTLFGHGNNSGQVNRVRNIGNFRSRSPLDDIDRAQSVPRCARDLNAADILVTKHVRGLPHFLHPWDATHIRIPFPYIFHSNSGNSSRRESEVRALPSSSSRMNECTIRRLLRPLEPNWISLPD